MTQLTSTSSDPASKRQGDAEVARTCLQRVVSEMHTTVVATVDDADKPVTCVVDMMAADESGLSSAGGVLAEVVASTSSRTSARPSIAASRRAAT